MTYHNVGFLLTGEEYNFNWIINDLGQMNSKAIRVFDRQKVNKVVAGVMSESLKKIETEQTNSN
jgi:hypothetical protein